MFVYSGKLKVKDYRVKIKLRTKRFSRAHVFYVDALDFAMRDKCHKKCNEILEYLKKAKDTNTITETIIKFKKDVEYLTNTFLGDEKAYDNLIGDNNSFQNLVALVLKLREALNFVNSVAFVKKGVEYAPTKNRNRQ